MKLMGCEYFMIFLFGLSLLMVPFCFIRGDIGGIISGIGSIIFITVYFIWRRGFVKRGLIKERENE